MKKIIKHTGEVVDIINISSAKGHNSLTKVQYMDSKGEYQVVYLANVNSFLERKKRGQ